MPKITVVIPTYNHANFLERCIESVLNQTFRDFELFIVDDGSTDNTPEIFQKYKDTRIIKLLKVNGGTGSALNLAFRYAKGLYRTWFSADNYMYEDSLFQLNKVLDDNKNIDFVYSAFDYAILKDGKEISCMPTTRMLKHEYVEGQLISNYNMGVSWLWRSELQEIVGEFQKAPCEDYDFALRCEEAGANFYYLDKVLCKYHLHENNITSGLRGSEDPGLMTRTVQERARVRRANSNYKLAV